MTVFNLISTNVIYANFICSALRQNDLITWCICKASNEKMWFNKFCG